MATLSFGTLNTQLVHHPPITSPPGMFLMVWCLPMQCLPKTLPFYCALSHPAISASDVSQSTLPFYSMMSLSVMSLPHNISSIKHCHSMAWCLPPNVCQWCLSPQHCFFMAQHLTLWHSPSIPLHCRPHNMYHFAIFSFFTKVSRRKSNQKTPPFRWNWFRLILNSTHIPKTF